MNADINKDNIDNKNNKNTGNPENSENPESLGAPESSFKRKLKYGFVAMIFTVVVIAVIFLANIVTSTIHNIRPLMIDMTKEQIYGITDASRELLKDVTAPVEIVFFMDIDMFEKQFGSYGKMITNCIKTFANEYDNITIRTVDIIKNPAAANEFKTSEISQLKTTSIAVKSGSTPKLLAWSAFFVIAESTGNPMGFAGEKVLTSSILQVTNTESPIVYFTKGHGEADLTENGLAALFAQNGFLVEQIDLLTEDVDPEAKIIVICNPRKDFLGADPNNPSAKSEIDKVASFLNNFGNVMYFSSPEVGALTELDSLMKEYNISFEHDNMLVDTKNAVDTEGLYLNAQYFVANGAGDELTASIRNLSSAPRTVVPKVKPVKILDATTAVNVSPVLKSADTAVKYNMTEGKAVSQGAFDLLVLAQRTEYRNNEPKSALVLACGSVDFLTSAALLSNSYSNSDVMLNAMRIMANRKVATDVKWKEFDSTALSMTLEEQNNWTLISMLLLPLIASAAGIAVWLRRRHS